MVMLAPIFALGSADPLRFGDGLFPTILLLAGSIWSYFIHANIRWRLGPIEWLVTTPCFHHWRHTYGGKRRDCNCASTLTWLDRMFGTHYLPKDWPERYGIEEPTPPTLAASSAIRSSRSALRSGSTAPRKLSSRPSRLC